MGKINENKGLTLIELLVVIGILAILSVIAIPIYQGYTRGAKKAEAKTNLESLYLLLEEYYADNGKYCPDQNCANQTYEYKENDNGDPITKTIIKNGNQDYLVRFKPKSATERKAVLYDYSITFDSSGNNYTIIADPVESRGAPDGNLNIDQDGKKSGSGW